MKYFIVLVLAVLVVGCGPSAKNVADTPYDGPKLDDYPNMFVKDNKFDGVIVVGDKAKASYVVSAVDVATGIQISNNLLVGESAIKDVLQQGEKKTYPGKNEYEIEVLFVGTEEAELKINGEVRIVKIFNSIKLDGRDELALKSIIPEEEGEIGQNAIEFFLSSGDENVKKWVYLKKVLGVGAAKLASEIKDVEQYNIIAVGTPENNPVVAKFIKKLVLPEGYGIIKLFNNGDKLALVVAGNSEIAVRRAARALAHTIPDSVFKCRGVIVRGEGLDDIVVSK